MTEWTHPTAGPCAGHHCDNCRICQRGRCCRKDNPEYQLPNEGDWDGPTYGDLGKLTLLPDDTMQCHICGMGFRGLGNHLVLHDVTSDEYRALFGLNRTTKLEAPSLHDERSAHARANYHTVADYLRAGREQLLALTPEQRAALHERPFRTQGVRSLTNRERPNGSNAGRPRSDIPPMIRNCTVCGVSYKASKRFFSKTCGSKECISQSRSHTQSLLKSGVGWSADHRASLAQNARIRWDAYKAAGMPYGKQTSDMYRWCREQGLSHPPGGAKTIAERQAIAEALDRTALAMME